MTKSHHFIVSLIFFLQGAVMQNNENFIYKVKRSVMLRAMLDTMRTLDFLQDMWFSDTVVVKLINEVLNIRNDENKVTENHLNCFIGKEMRYKNLTAYDEGNDVG